MKVVDQFGPDGANTWRQILNYHSQKRESQVCEIFNNGLKILKIQEDRVPDLKQVNSILKELTGFEGVFVDGLESGSSFYKMLANRQFPIGNFIRDSKDLGYTPAPDLVHDLYGHLPFFTDIRYANFCAAFGKAASVYAENPVILRQFERFFWFTIEFGLIKTPKGIRIFGAGIASSVTECDYALSSKPEVVPFDVNILRHQEFEIDRLQDKLFVLESVEQLYSSLPLLVEQIQSDAKKMRLS